MARDRFQNPVNGQIYNFPVNHDEEEPTTKSRTITRTANTGNIGAVRQQGDDGALLLKYHGRTPYRAQAQGLWAWYNLSKNQTIYFYDYDNQGYEVQITELSVTRRRKLSYFGKDPSAPHHTYEWSITMEVYAVLAGDMVGVAP